MPCMAGIVMPNLPHHVTQRSKMGSVARFQGFPSPGFHHGSLAI
jgi:hypothetical protein